MKGAALPLGSANKEESDCQFTIGAFEDSRCHLASAEVPTPIAVRPVSNLPKLHQPNAAAIKRSEQRSNPPMQFHAAEKRGQADDESEFAADLLLCNEVPSYATTMTSRSPASHGRMPDSDQ